MPWQGLYDYAKFIEGETSSGSGVPVNGLVRRIRYKKGNEKRGLPVISLPPNLLDRSNAVVDLAF